MQNVLVGHDTPQRFCVVDELCAVQLTPSVVERTLPSVPTAVQMVEITQLRELRVSSEPASTLGTKDQVVPPSVVL
jgi:hypothetical protein